MTPQVWPVIHLSYDRRNVENAQIAARCGCSGVFLISMSGRDEQVDPAANLIRRVVPDLKVGINLLTMDPALAVIHAINHGYDATWSDYAWQHTYIEKLIDGRDHQFFAAVGFKGETYNEADPKASARQAVARGFIPMTSGSGTGIAASISKIASMRNAVGPDAPLAMSGVDVARMDELAPLVSHFLIATCVSKNFYEFDEAMLTNFMTKMKGATS
jgi:hypothetical protein